MKMGSSPSVYQECKENLIFRNPNISTKKIVKEMQFLQRAIKVSRPPIDKGRKLGDLDKDLSLPSINYKGAFRSRSLSQRRKINRKMRIKIKQKVEKNKEKNMQFYPKDIIQALKAK